MAVIAAVGVSIIYVPQPIQTLAAHELGVPLAQSSSATVAVQAGYAVGVVFLVSLGDRLIPRRQVSIQLAVTAAAILVAALAGSFALLTVMMFAAGVAATVGQILVSAALRLAPPEVRARTAAVLVGSFLIGLFGVRTLLGTFAEALGWRTVLVGAAVLVLACIPLTLRFAPGSKPPGSASYLAILGSIPRIVAGSRTLRLLTRRARRARWALPRVVRDEQLAGLQPGQRAGLRRSRRIRPRQHGVHSDDVLRECGLDRAR